MSCATSKALSKLILIRFDQHEDHSDLFVLSWLAPDHGSTAAPLRTVQRSAKMSAGSVEDAATVEAEAAALLAKCKTLSQRVSVYSKKLVGEQDALAVEIKSLQANLQRLRKATASVKVKSQQAPIHALLSETEAIINGVGPGGDLKRICSPKTPRLLSYLLGDKVNIVTLRKDQAMAIREEYHAFRKRAVWLMGVAPMLLYLGMKRADHVVTEGHSMSLAPPLLTGIQAYFAWLCYFYVAMALRESVLLVNGSHIRSWWIHHHIWSAAGSLLMLSLPISSPTVYYFAEKFMLWSAFQALVMLVQNRYQKRRMYTRIAMGKNSAMDVVSGESSGSAGQLMVLYPLLFILQGWQLSIGVDLAVKTWPALVNPEGWLEQEHRESDLRGMRGTFLCGCVFSFLAIMNGYNTIRTITEKQQRQRQK